jgi:2-polyprenyl-3-methyl-5-hydroxy-6-metoxy-1,4-benzoquinol methylase
MKVVQTEYGWRDERPNCAHDYVLPEVLAQVRAISRGRPLRILDVGCGNGSVAARLAEEGHSVVAVDVSSDGIEIARAAFRNVRFEVCSVYDDRLTSIVPGENDCVVALEVVEHLFFPKRLFEQSYRMLKPGGRLVVSTPYYGYLKNLGISLVNGWDRHFHVAQDGGHIKFFSRAALERMALEAGFHSPHFRGVGRVPWLWKSMVLVAAR